MTPPDAKQQAEADAEREIARRETEKARQVAEEAVRAAREEAHRGA